MCVYACLFVFGVCAWNRGAYLASGSHAIKLVSKRAYKFQMYTHMLFFSFFSLIIPHACSTDAGRLMAVLQLEYKMPGCRIIFDLHTSSLVLDVH